MHWTLSGLSFKVEYFAVFVLHFVLIHEDFSAFVLHFIKKERFFLTMIVEKLIKRGERRNTVEEKL